MSNYNLYSSARHVLPTQQCIKALAKTPASLAANRNTLILKAETDGRTNKQNINNCKHNETNTSQTSRMMASCTAHPQHTNRAIFRLPVGNGADEWIREQGGEKVLLARYERVAQAWLRDARTLTAMSREMGELPSSCLPSGSDQRLCVWRTTKSTYGHGTVAISIGARPQNKVILRCHFPQDGRPRMDGSCAAEVGD